MKRKTNGVDTVDKSRDGEAEPPIRADEPQRDPEVFVAVRVEQLIIWHGKAIPQLAVSLKDVKSLEALKAFLFSVIRRTNAGKAVLAGGETKAVDDFVYMCGAVFQIVDYKLKYPNGEGDASMDDEEDNWDDE